MLQKFDLMHSSDSRYCLQENVTTGRTGVERWGEREKKKNFSQIGKNIY